MVMYNALRIMLKLNKDIDLVSSLAYPLFLLVLAILFSGKKLKLIMLMFLNNRLPMYIIRTGKD